MDKLPCDCGSSGDGLHSPLCSSWKTSTLTPFTKPAEQEKTVRVVMVNGNFFDFPAPEGFSMVGYVTSIRATGYILNDALYVPVDQIQSLFIYAGDTLPPSQGTIIKFPGKPTP